MRWIKQQIHTEGGYPLRHGKVYVFTDDGVTLASLVNEHGDPIQNPIQTDFDGYTDFYVTQPIQLTYRRFRSSGQLYPFYAQLLLAGTIETVDFAKAVLVQGTLGASVTSGQVLSLHPDGMWYPAGCDILTDSTSHLGVTVVSASGGSVANVAVSGVVELVGYSFTPSSPLYLGLAGNLTNVPELPGSVFARRIGTAIGVNSLGICIEPAILL